MPLFAIAISASSGAAKVVSLIGTWMQTIGQGWLVLQLTDSPLKLGLVSAAQFTPVLFFSLLGGAIADRFPKRNIILLTQLLLLVQAVILAVLTGSGAIRYEHVLVMAFTLGTINSVDMPTRQAFIMEMASREDVMNAIALNSTAFNSARLVGPALAGLVLAEYRRRDLFRRECRRAFWRSSSASTLSSPPRSKRSE